MNAERWRRLSALFASLRRRGPASRAALLDAMCEPGDALRADVEDLLRHELPSTPAIDVVTAQLAHVGSRSAAGATLGSYTLQALLGEGGMGQVYRARDAVLGRDVAVKILPPMYAVDPDRRSRFEREARLLASLNHPHIGAIYGIAEGDGLHGLVLELIEGETLAERLERARSSAAHGRGLPVGEALSIARQIAEGLEAAHDRGIIHRDLKPANVKITPEGMVKVLDFGLAKTVTTDEVVDTSSTTLVAVSDTWASALVGTAAYMSPEQAQGAAVDKRTDIWAFGCVLYEMLAGARAFGDDRGPAAGAGLQPDWHRLPADVSPSILALLRRCLEHDARRRLRDIGEARVLIDDVLAAPPALPRATVARWRWTLAIWGTVAIVGVAAAIAAFRNSASTDPEVALHVRRVEVPVAASQRPAPLLGIALSADGTRVAYVANEESYNRLCVRALERSDTHCLEGTEGAAFPFWSADGEWVAYFAGGQLHRVPTAGGSSVAITRAERNLTLGGGGGTWAADGNIIFSDGTGLWTVPASGDRPPVALTRPDRRRGEISHLRPTLLPDQRTLLYIVWRGPGWDERDVIAHRLNTGESRVLLPGAGVARYVPSGHLIYSRAGVLMAAPFDLSRLELSGSPVAVQEGVREGTLNADWDVAADGSLVFVPQSREVFLRQPAWIDRSGTITPLPGVAPAYVQNPVISPDGTRAAFMITAGTIDIWIYEFTRAALTRVTTEGSSQYPVWSADGTRIAYRATRRGTRNLYWRRVEGSVGEERLTSSPHVQTPWSFSRDGRMLAFAEETTSGTHFGLLSLFDGSVRLLTREGTSNTKSKLSPDGRSVAYVSNRSGRNEVYVQTLDSAGRRWQISADGGTDPVWAPNGRELYYRRGAAILAVRVGGDPLRPSAPRQLFEAPFFRSEPTIDYDIHPDGRRFLIVQPVRPDPPLTHLNLVLNWHAELTARVPARRDSALRLGVR